MLRVDNDPLHARLFVMGVSLRSSFFLLDFPIFLLVQVVRLHLSYFFSILIYYGQQVTLGMLTFLLSFSACTAARHVHGASPRVAQSSFFF